MATRTAARMQIKRLDFEGERINFVQIGLGTNSTFIQNCGGQWHEWDKNIDWLLWACSEHQQDKVRGIAVEPMDKLVDALHGPADRIPLVALVQVAMGECEVRCADMQVFSVTERDRFVQQVPDEKQAEVKRSLEYLVNMSSVGVAPPCFRDTFSGSPLSTTSMLLRRRGSQRSGLGGRWPSSASSLAARSW